MTKWNDTLVDSMKRGEQAALKQCYLQLSPIIFTAILSICKNRHDANDLLQDTFVDAFDNLAAFHQQVPFIAWLKRIAFNNTFNFLKKSKRLTIGTDHLPEAVSMKNSIESDYENRNLLLYLFERLSEMECLIMWLYIAEQYKHSEIAEVLGKTSNYSKSVVARCLQKLRANAEVKKYVDS
ncbi:RNA polymerase sigma factor [Colwellia hornerae]|uniref:Sigma-70 family RNA polymerase sigma factor n=1 Tax=Colwellia hornerae TaxID=89402 RepID=A0A5C6QIH2_9GAMM|nr:sigma-70 family RNA polymerase sigma factor [Colwellia hornerae]TWX52434.1 sigma-70 family RNA polymerase sigma factor [Colwellia hornerae]TWX58263.1 sigma-70 family RNA polymerase sigma factor [Colwellia hornerae]TWX68392.1 sigma-70 family RNA polymerase sigma factor [Colwellia hornerae]